MQTTYNFATKKGVAGGLLDLTPKAIDSRVVESASIEFGCPAYHGTTPGKTIKDTGSVFDGVTVNGRTTEHDLDGNVVVKKGSAIGVLKYGRIYVQVDSAASGIAYGTKVYIDGNKFTNDTTKTAINAIFVGAVENGVAPIELYNAPYVEQAAATPGEGG